MQSRCVSYKNAIALCFAKKALALPETLKLVEILCLTPGKTHYPMLMNDMNHDPNSIGIRTRSVMGLLYYLSQSVEVPQEDVRSGRLTTTRCADGSPFCWSDIFNNLFQIKFSSKRPSDAYMSLKYRGSWFYLDDTDIESKRSYSLFKQIFAIQAGKIKIEKPILTLPLGR